jgi:hypothetical protein
MSPIIQPDTSAALDLTASEPGVYHAKIIKADFQMSKAGNPMVVPTFELTVNGRKKERRAFLVTSGEGSGQFDQLLRACHMEELANAYKDPTATHPPFDTDTLVGQELDIQVENDLYQGRKTDVLAVFLKA